MSDDTEKAQVAQQLAQGALYPGYASVLEDDRLRMTRAQALELVFRIRGSKGINEMLVEADIVMKWLYDGAVPGPNLREVK